MPKKIKCKGLFASAMEEKKNNVMAFSSDSAITKQDVIDMINSIKTNYAVYVTPKLNEEIEEATKERAREMGAEILIPEKIEPIPPAPKPKKKQKKQYGKSSKYM